MFAHKSGMITIPLVALFLIAAAGSVSAHCDRLDGPVANDARTALESGQFTPIAAWVGEDQTEALREAYQRAREVRTESEAARELADRYFIETAVRLHREAEGMPFTGVKPAGLDTPPDIAAADKAYETGKVGPVIALLQESVVEHVQHLFDRAVETQEHAPDDLQAARAKTDAYVQYIVYVHGLYERIQAGPEHGVGNDHAALSQPHK